MLSSLPLPVRAPAAEDQAFNTQASVGPSILTPAWSQQRTAVWGLPHSPHRIGAEPVQDLTHIL